MRLLLIRTPEGKGSEVLRLANEHKGVSLTVVKAASDTDEPADLVLAHLSNQRVESFLADLESIENTHITVMPQGVMALRPPSDEAPDQVRNVEPRSPIEIFLGGIQSVGSWKGFLSYAAVAGAVVWIGLFTNTAFLLVAAMLIAPFAGPAMTLALGTARGDKVLISRSVGRYFSALAVSIAVAAALSWILQQEVATPKMVEQSLISSVAVLLPLAAGAAGALNLVQSERNSLVSGAAVGALVAASLAPPAGVVGMGAAIGRWDLVIDNFFLLLLQLVGINFSASLVFRAYGLTSRGARYDRGQNWLFATSLTASILGLALLAFWQFHSRPELQRSTEMQRAVAIIQKAVEESDLVKLVEANARFTRSQIEEQDTLLSVVYVQRADGVTSPSEEIRESLTRRIQERILEKKPDVTPLVDVALLEEPPGRK